LNFGILALSVSKKSKGAKNCQVVAFKSKELSNCEKTCVHRFMHLFNKIFELNWIEIENDKYDDISLPKLFNNTVMQTFCYCTVKPV
jgi:hypothetical protein